MITAIVRFRLPEGITLEEASERFQETAPKYQSVPGLVRKYYLYRAEATAGGVYLWESLQAAERFHDDAWKRFVTETYGTAPEITFFETPVVVDNTSRKIIVEAA